MTKSLYQDFTLTHENCDAEPIHRPIAIQGHGHILVFDRNDLSVLYGISAHCHELFDVSQDDMWRTHPSLWLPKDIWEALSKITSLINDDRESINDKSNEHPLLYSKLHANVHYKHKQGYQVLLHSHENCTIVEFEPEITSLGLNFSDMQQTIESFKNCDSSQQLYTVTTQKIKNMLQYDRVMIYKFDQDFHGYILGEAKEEGLDPFLGLHYPSTDIPPMARALFLLNKSRIIHNIHQDNSELIFNPHHALPIPYLNLSMSELRATSPIHIEYLSNMGVQASLTLAIIINSELWGLVACHHYSPRAITYNERKLGETIADAFCAALLATENKETQRQIEAYAQASNDLLDNIRINDHYTIDVLDDCRSLMDLCECDGAAIFSAEYTYSSYGVAPDVKTIEAIKEWLIQNNADRIYATHNLCASLPNDIGLSNNIGGMLVARISEITDTYLFWFRVPQKQIISWAGDPRNAVVVSANKETNTILLSPRKSFEKWQEAIEDKSYPWPRHSIMITENLSKAILKKEFERTANLVLRSKNELEQLVYSASHDLQEPIRTQLNYLSFLQEDIKEIENTDTHELNFYVERSRKAATRMQLLIKNLLDYSKLGIRQTRSELNLNNVVDEIKEDLAEVLTTQKVTINCSSLPLIIGSHSEIKQLFQNLITNAVKYVHAGTKPLIDISYLREGDFITLLFKDNGIGIEKCYSDKIFLMFQRLHLNEEYEGTGIGLALCKKVADSYDAEISVESSKNNGSTFKIRFHKHYFKDK